MNTVTNKHRLYVCMGFILLPFLLGGCGATEETTELPECRPSSSENCEVLDEKDRRYDPCLINKNLPVCKS